MATQTLADRATTLAPTGVAPLLTTTELAAYYGVTPWTVNEWVKAGLKPEPVKIRGRRFDLNKVMAWQAGHDQDAAGRELASVGA